MADEDRARLNRRQFLRAGMLTAAAGAAAAVGRPASGQEASTAPVAPGHKQPPRAAASFELEEATIADLRRGLDSGAWSAHALTAAYLSRIADLDGPARGETEAGLTGLRSMIEINPDALAIADALDAERKAGRSRGPLHGIPVVIKDNIDTADRMMTTAGSLALLGSIAPRDSFVAQRLREAGAVILGKTNLSEWANIRSSHSSSGWSGRGGQCRNPYALDRSPCGSSSGTGAAVSANFAAVGVGTETDGSIVCPSQTCGLVGIKPTVGLVSRAGIIPISHSQDTAGPIARTVTDAAALLTVLAGPDPRDPATARAGDHAQDYTKFLDPAGLRGARIGIARGYFGFSARVDAIMEEVIAVLKSGGAEIVDPADIPTAGKFDAGELDVLLYELKADLNAYLAGLGPNAPVKTLADLIAFNEEHKDVEMPYFGQELFIEAEKKGPLTDKAYLKALTSGHTLSREKGIDALVKKHRLDAILAPTGGPAWTIDLVNGDHFSGGSSSAAAVAGYPDITVPAGFIFGLPVGVSFFGQAWSEPALFRIAYAYEQASKVRKPPRFLTSVESAV